MAEEKRFISVFFVILQSLIYTVFAMDERLDKVKVQCDYLPLINFAIQQNGASIIHQLSIENTTPAPLKDIQVQITTEPTFGNAAPIAVAQIPPNESICLSSFNLTLSANYFTQLTERLSGNLKIEITSEAESVFCQTSNGEGSMYCPKCWPLSSPPIIQPLCRSSREPLPSWDNGLIIRPSTNIKAALRTG